jgi:integrase
LELTTIKQTVNWLVREKHLTADCLIHLPLEKPQGTDTYCWRPEEVQAMLGCCRKAPPLRWLGDVLEILTYSGMRISEAIGLRWSKVHFAKGTIELVDETFSRVRTRGATVGTIKNGKSRVIPIHEEIRPLLERIPRHPDGYVLHGPEGGRLKADVVRRALIRDVLAVLKDRFPTAANEFGFATGRLHSFRHFFCSQCATRNISRQVTMRWLGHSDSKMVDHYFTLHDEESQSQMRRFKLGEAQGA